MEKSTEPVTLERIRRDAQCVIIRVGLGYYELGGPRENILVPESRVAWATVVHDLAGEGYVLVSPEDYAEAVGGEVEEILTKVHVEGSVFAVVYGECIALSLPEKGKVFPDIKALSGME